MTKLNLYEAPESIFIELRSSKLLMASGLETEGSVRTLGFNQDGTFQDSDWSIN